MSVFAAIGSAVLVLGVLCAAIAVFWTSSPRRRDKLARRYALGQMRVDRILGADGQDEDQVRTFLTFVVDLEDSGDRVGASLVVLAKTPEVVAEAISAAGERARKMDELATTHRLVSAGSADWAVVMLPNWLGFIASDSSFGEAHAS